MGFKLGSGFKLLSWFCGKKSVSSLRRKSCRESEDLGGFLETFEGSNRWYEVEEEEEDDDNWEEVE